jgi:hypothetical protein
MNRSLPTAIGAIEGGYRDEEADMRPAMGQVELRDDLGEDCADVAMNQWCRR